MVKITSKNRRSIKAKPLHFSDAIVCLLLPVILFYSIHNQTSSKPSTINQLDALFKVTFSTETASKRVEILSTVWFNIDKSIH